MKLVIAIIALAVIPLAAKAQVLSVRTTTLPRTDSMLSNGEDFWFSMPAVYEDQGGRSYVLYVTSDVSTTVHIGSSLGRNELTVQAAKVAAFDIPLGWEMKSSGVVEQKAIHVWADTGSLTVSLFSSDPASNDATYILPTKALGRDYVVASYAPLFDGSAELQYDYPSEFTVTTGESPAMITITPTCDIRGNSPATVLHPRGVTFTEVLAAGRSILYQATQPVNDTGFDLTGTTIHSDAPIQVIGASQCPQIPADFPFCDFVQEALPPIESWGATYYSAPFTNRPGGDTFLLVGTEAGQEIYRYARSSGSRLVAKIPKDYARAWVGAVADACRWYSDHPFLVVQYMNSSMWPDGTSHLSDPAMAVLNPVEHYASQLQVIANASATVIVRDTSAHSTYYGDRPITDYPRTSIDSEYSVYRLDSMLPGARTIRSTSGISAVSHGIGYYSASAQTSYGWKTHTYFGSADTTSPFVSSMIQSDCVRLTAIETHSYLADIAIAGGTNCTVSSDSAVALKRQKGVTDICVIDTFRQSRAILSYTDVAGNKSVADVTYEPGAGSLHLDLHPIPNTQVGARRTVPAFSLRNTSGVPVRVDDITTDDYALEPDKLALRLPFILTSGASVEVPFIFAPDAAITFQVNVRVLSSNAPGLDTIVQAVGTDLGVSTSSLRGDGTIGIETLPTRNHVAVLSNREAGTLQISVIDLLGRPVLSFAVYALAGRTRIELPTSALPAGIYFCRVMTPDKAVRTARFEAQ